MKKIFLPLTLFAMMGCSDNNDEKEDDQRTMIGTWKMTKVEAYKSSIKEMETRVPTGCDAEMTNEFRSGDMTTIHFTKKNNVCVPDETVTRKYTYDQQSKKFWYEEEDDYPYRVPQLTATQMILESNVDDIDGDGINDIIKYYFQRIK